MLVLMMLVLGLPMLGMFGMNPLLVVGLAPVLWGREGRVFRRRAFVEDQDVVVLVPRLRAVVFGGDRGQILGDDLADRGQDLLHALFRVLFRRSLFGHRVGRVFNRGIIDTVR